MKMERVSHMPLMPGHGTGAVTEAYQGQTGGSHNEADGLCCRDLLAINGGFNGTIVMGVAVPPECCGHVLTMTEVNTYADWIVVSISAHCLPKKHLCRLHAAHHSLPSLARYDHGHDSLCKTLQH